MAKITEVAPDLFRITTFLEPFNLQFSQFLVRDEQPLLFHTGPRTLFADVKEAVASLINVRMLRWISFSGCVPSYLPTPVGATRPRFAVNC